MIRAPRIGLIGAGPWGRNYIRTLTQFPGVELVAVASRNPGTTALVSLEVAVIPDWRDLVSHPEIDAVIVATPPSVHADMAVAALQAGKAVLVEKPLAQNVADAASIAAAAARAGRPVLVGHTHLFHPGFAGLCAEVAKRGPIKAIRASAGNNGPHRADVPVLWDWGPHDVAMALTVLGQVPAVRSTRRLRAGPDGTGECIQLHLRVDPDIPVTITLSNIDDRHRWFAVDLDAETLIYRDRGASPLTLFDHPGASPEQPGRGLTVAGGLPLTAQVAAFVKLVEQGAPSSDSLALGVRVVEILSRCETAARHD